MRVYTLEDDRTEDASQHPRIDAIANVADSPLQLRSDSLAVRYVGDPTFYAVVAHAGVPTLLSCPGSFWHPLLPVDLTSFVLSHEEVRSAGMVYRRGLDTEVELSEIVKVPAFANVVDAYVNMRNELLVRACDLLSGSEETYFGRTLLTPGEDRPVPGNRPDVIWHQWFDGDHCCVVCGDPMDSRNQQVYFDGRPMTRLADNDALARLRALWSRVGR